MHTRRQAAAEKMLKVYEDYPASPSPVEASTSQVPARQPVVHSPPRDVPSSVPPTSDEQPHQTVPRPAEDKDRAPDRREKARSVRSFRSTASVEARIKQAELEAEERFAEIRREELRIQAMLIKKRLAADVATIREETDRESIGAEQIEDTETELRINDWLRQSHIRGEKEKQDFAGQTRNRSPPRKELDLDRERCPPKDLVTERVRRHRSPSPTRSPDKGIERLADAMERMVRHRNPPRQTQDLPVFSGAVGEWLPFKAAMRESTKLHRFSSVENLARLRTCLKGEARQAVSALLYTATEPKQIMKTLEQCYGRPEMIIDTALEDIKKLPRLGQATSAGELNSFAIKLQNIVTVISCMDERGYLQNPMLTRQVTEKLTPHIRSKWCDYAEDFENRNEPEIVVLTEFLMREADRAMRHAFSPTATPVATTRTTTNANAKNADRPQQRNRGAVYATTEIQNKKKDSCFCCGAEHETSKCKKLIAMPVSKRWEWAKETHICFQCLNKKHRRVNCNSKKCGIEECREPHHALLHPTIEREHPTQNEESVITASAHLSENDCQVLLKVCPITVKGCNGKEVTTYALLDEGSTITLIDEEIAGMIGAEGPIRALCIHGVTSSQQESDSRVVNVEIRGRSQKGYHPISARTVKNLTLGSQSIKEDVLKQAHLKNLRSEDVCYAYGRPRMLIGADNWHLIVTRKLLTGKRSQPAASLTRLGWIIHGSIPRSIVAQGENVLHVRTQQDMLKREMDNELSELVKAHFNIDALGVSMKRKPIEKEERAIEIFNRTAKRIEGRFEVGLPWKTDDVTLPPSYDMAVSRLRGIERKMDQSPQFKDAYTAEVNKLFDKGYAVRCKEDHHDNPRMWYLPHFAVTNPNKPGKVRMVFDAAAKANEICLNDVLLDGPDLLQTLYGVLFRFREKPIAVTADIREMFLQVKIREEDRVAQHFLWRGDDRMNPPQQYMMTSMIFGARSSPFMAHSVRNRNASDHKESHPLAYRAITENHYMDDWLDSFSSMEIATDTIAEVQEVHREAGFVMASWGSSDSGLLETIPAEECASAPKELGSNAHACGKTLGLLWQHTSDQLAFNTAMHRVPLELRTGERAPSKREVLAAVMSLYDPLGLLSPYTISAKIMLQGLWRKSLGWDDSLPPEEASIFHEWMTDLEYITNLQLPRCYEKDGRIKETQLHVFNDASDSAYATAAYWRFLKEDGSVKVVLIAGKAKVAPMKAQSIPRMELQASLIGARLSTEIINKHRDASNTRVIFWSDSKTVLHWIRNDSVRYTPFVAHRLSEIAELTKVDQWRWIPTAHNVADDATRSGNTRLRATDRWFVGPDFLYKSEDCWPQEEGSKVMSLEENIVAHTTETTPLVEFERFSSYERLVRAIGYALAFIDKCRRRATALELKHIHEAERLLIKESQNTSFCDELRRLKTGKNVDRTSRLYKLDPVYSEDGLIRLHGRINAALIPNQMKNPPILDGMHPFTRLLIKNEHEKYQHVGREQIVNNIRQKYWVLRLRPAVRSVLKECVWCRMRKSKPSVPVKGDLPQARLSAYTKPFSRCGIDCFGPMIVTIGRRREKRWGMLFTCLVTRAIHIEMIASLNIDSAVMALRRMAARRSWPELIMSDNGTNFRGADIELKRAYQEWLPRLQEYALSKRTEWRFIDPGAPNQGGVWERMIATVKRALHSVLHERAPKEEVLLTVMAEIEHTVNSRPLTHVPVSPDDAEALTPNHFLLGSANGLPHIGPCDEADRRTWRAAQALANMFWARWVKEYLPTLAPRNDVRAKSATNIREGDVVIIADGLLPRNVWPRGQVERVFKGPDGVVRSAEVRTRGGLFRRPVRRLIVLPGVVRLEDLRRGETVADKEHPSLE